MKYPTAVLIDSSVNDQYEQVSIEETQLIDVESCASAARHEGRPSIISLNSLAFLTDGGTKWNDPLIEIRTGRAFAGKGFWLNDKFDWQVVRDSAEQLILVPLKKKE